MQPATAVKPVKVTKPAKAVRHVDDAKRPDGCGVHARDNGFTVSVVCFGDHYELAHRCLAHLIVALDFRYVFSVRVALNNVGSRTRDFVFSALSQLKEVHEVLIYDAGSFNRLKYPMLRKMLYDPDHPVVTPYFMHFDDDS